MLTERQKLILHAIVDDYVRSAEPVGSRSISKRGDVAFSAATIRNEMSDLEELGYLEQPHTSAGRVPSNKGYRYYVDHLMQRKKLEVHEIQMIKSFFADKLQEVEQVIRHVAHIMASLTNYTSIVLGPEVYQTTLKLLQVVPLNQSSAVAIIVTSTGQVENRVFTIPEGVPMSEIEKFVRILNEKLKGEPLLHLRSKIETELIDELRRHVMGYEKLVQVFDYVMSSDHLEERVYMSGTANMLNQPEFRDVDRLKSILDVLEETPKLVRLFSGIPEGLSVRIGSENTLETVNECSLITATYSIDGKSLGTIGILGPTRMEYGKVINLLSHLTHELAIVLEKWYK